MSENAFKIIIHVFRSMGELVVQYCIITILWGAPRCTYKRRWVYAFEKFIYFRESETRKVIFLENVKYKNILRVY